MIHSCFQNLHELSSCPKVIDISKRKPGSEPPTEHLSPASQLLDNFGRVNSMQKDAMEVGCLPLSHEFEIETKPP